MSRRRRPEGIEAPHPVLHLAVPEHEPGDRPGAGPEALDVVVVDDGDGSAGQPLGEDDVLRARVDDGLLVVGVGPAFGGRDEARAHLNAGVAEVHHAPEGGRIADAAGANHRQSEAAELVEQGFGRQPAGVSAGHVVDRDQAVHAALDRLLRPLPFGDVVVDDAANLRGPVDDPAGVPERRDDEANALLERDVDPPLDTLAVGLRRLFDERVHAKRAGVARLISRSPSRKSWP